MARFLRPLVPALALSLVSSTAAGQPLRSLERLGPAPGAPDAESVVLDKTRQGVVLSHSAYPLPDGKVEWRPADPWKAIVEVPLPSAVSFPSHLSVWPEITVRRKTIELEPRVVAVEREGERTWVRVPLEHPFLASPLARTSEAIRLRARPAPESAVLGAALPARPVPAGSQLVVAFGFLEDAWGPGATVFRVRACWADDCRVLFREQASPARQSRWISRRVAIPDGFGVADGSGPTAEPRTPQNLVFHLEAVREPAGPRTDFPVWSVPTVVGPAPSPPGEHDLILISLDTLRADHLGIYGHHRDTSPFIDRELAARGTVFERALSTASTTGPSHMSMFTGLPPAVHGVHTDFARVLPDGVPILAEELRRRGFATAAFTEDGPMASFRGFDRGFDSFYENRGESLRETAGHVEETLARGARWLRQNADRRRFLFLHTYQVHSPYEPPTAYRSYFLDSRPVPEPLQGLPGKWWPVSYDREIRYTDAQLERFFHEMEAQGLLDDTVVILTSDHGEEFAEHGALVHGPAVHGEVLHVPLILRGPGIARGRRISQPVSGVDLMATALELVGAEGDVAGRWGRSLAPFVRPGVEAKPEPRPVFSEARAAVEIRPGENDVERRTVPIPIFAAQLGERKLIRYPGNGQPRYEYFHLDEDPGELQDRWDPNDPEAAALRDLLEAHLRASEAGHLELHGGGEARVDPEGLEPELVEKLRALGYLE